MMSLFRRYVGAPLITHPFLYHPTRVDVERLARGRWGLERVQVEPQVRISGLVRPAPQPAPWLLFFGGNAMGLDALQAILAMVAGPDPTGLAAFAYRGYDHSEGKPSQEAILADARKIASHLEGAHGVEPRRLVIMGQSLGTGVAVDLAAHLSTRGTPPAAVVLLSPYTSMAQVFADQVPLLPVAWAVSDPYRSEAHVDALPGPVLLVHGERDTLIRIEHSERMAAALGSRAQLLRLPHRDHNDLWEERGVVLAIRQLLKSAVT